MTLDPAPYDPDDDALWHKRWWLALSAVALAVSVTTLKLSQDLGWDWGLFVWAVGVGVVLNPSLYLKAITGRQELDGPARLRVRRRTIIYGSSWLGSGLLAGAMSAMLGLAWVDIAFTAYGVLVVVAMVVLGVVLRGRMARQD